MAVFEKIELNVELIVAQIAITHLFLTFPLSKPTNIEFFTWQIVEGTQRVFPLLAII